MKENDDDDYELTRPNAAIDGRVVTNRHRQCQVMMKMKIDDHED